MSRMRAVSLAEIEAAYRAHGHHVQRRAMLILGDDGDAREVRNAADGVCVDCHGISRRYCATGSACL